MHEMAARSHATTGHKMRCVRSAAALRAGIQPSALQPQQELWVLHNNPGHAGGVDALITSGGPGKGVRLASPRSSDSGHVTKPGSSASSSASAGEDSSSEEVGALPVLKCSAVSAYGLTEC